MVIYSYYIASERFCNRNMEHNKYKISIRALFYDINTDVVSELPDGSK